MEEGQLKTHFKMCLFTWTVLCKPTRNGCTNYLLVFKSGYI